MSRIWTAIWASLLERFKSGSYKTPPVRRVDLPKPEGGRRPIGIPTMEDKILQRAVATVQEPIYEWDFLDRRVNDRVIRRILQKRLKVGVMEEGKVHVRCAGTPQGGVISLLLANIYLHEVLDVWSERDVIPSMRGRRIMFRYAKDGVLVFEHKDDEEQVMAVPRTTQSITGTRKLRLDISRLSAAAIDWRDMATQPPLHGGRLA